MNSILAAPASFIPLGSSALRTGTAGEPDRPRHSPGSNAAYGAASGNGSDRLHRDPAVEDRIDAERLLADACGC